MIASFEPGMSPALLVRAPQKARPGLNFGPGRATGPKLCISNMQPTGLARPQNHLLKKNCGLTFSYNWQQNEMFSRLKNTPIGIQACHGKTNQGTHFRPPPVLADVGPPNLEVGRGETPCLVSQIPYQCQKTSVSETRAIFCDRDAFPFS